MLLMIKMALNTINTSVGFTTKLMLRSCKYEVTSSPGELVTSYWESCSPQAQHAFRISRAVFVPPAASS